MRIREEDSLLSIHAGAGHLWLKRIKKLTLDHTVSRNRGSVAFSDVINRVVSADY